MPVVNALGIFPFEDASDEESGCPDIPVIIPDEEYEAYVEVQLSGNLDQLEPKDTSGVAGLGWGLREAKD